MPFVIVLTGSIGMGKSTTAEMFAQEGVPVWSADETVHRLYEAGGAAVDEVRKLCPKAIKNGAVDRGILSNWIAEAPDRLKAIEAVVHPLVAADRAAFISQANDPIVVLDVPLLFETNTESMADAIVVVSAPAQEQRKRVLDRPGMTADKLALILSKQVSDSEKRAKADYVVDTLTIDAARARVRSILAEIRDQLNA